VAGHAEVGCWGRSVGRTVCERDRSLLVIAASGRTSRLPVMAANGRTGSRQGMPEPRCSHSDLESLQPALALIGRKRIVRAPRWLSEGPRARPRLVVLVPSAGCAAAWPARSGPRREANLNGWNSGPQSRQGPQHPAALGAELPRANPVLSACRLVPATAERARPGLGLVALPPARGPPTDSLDSM
jgi:hypothetical protein